MTRNGNHRIQKSGKTNIKLWRIEGAGSREVFLVLVLAVCSVGWSVHSVDADTVGCLEYFGPSESVNLQISAAAAFIGCCHYTSSAWMPTILTAQHPVSIILKQSKHKTTKPINQ